MAAKGSHIMEAKSHRNQFGRPSGPGDLCRLMRANRYFRRLDSKLRCVIHIETINGASIKWWEMIWYWNKEIVNCFSYIWIHLDSELLGYAVGQSVYDGEIASFSSTKDVDLQSVEILFYAYRISLRECSVCDPKRPDGVVLPNVWIQSWPKAYPDC